MSDEEWAFFEPFVVETGPKRGRRPRKHRLVLDGVFWIARTGTARRDLHSHFGERRDCQEFRVWVGHNGREGDIPWLDGKTPR